MGADTTATKDPLFLRLAEVVHHIHQVKLKDRELTVERDGWTIEFHGLPGYKIGPHFDISLNGFPAGVISLEAGMLAGGLEDELRAWCDSVLEEQPQ